MGLKQRPVHEIVVQAVSKNVYIPEFQRDFIWVHPPTSGDGMNSRVKGGVGKQLVSGTRTPEGRMAGTCSSERFHV